MNLVPILTGNVKPTCGDDGVHTPFVMIIEGHPVRFIIRPNLPLHLMVAWVIVDVARALGSKKPQNAGESLNLIEGEDKGSDTIGTPGGPQRLRVFTSKGLTKFLMKSRHPAAERFQDELAKKNDDLMYYGIAFRETDAQAGLAALIDAKLEALLPRAIAAAVDQVANGLPAIIKQSLSDSLQVAPRYALDRSKLPRHSKLTDLHEASIGYTRARPFLTERFKGVDPGAHCAAEFTKKVVRFCGEAKPKPIDVHVYRDAVYIHTETAQKVWDASIFGCGPVRFPLGQGELTFPKPPSPKPEDPGAQT